jgi:Zn-dependent peptidase ImmA (M78 family)
MKVKFLSFEQLKDAAKNVLSESKYKDKIPVDIEKIVEIEFKIEIIPIFNLEKSFHMPAFISKDLKTISIDEKVMEGFLSRYRFSLAHELAHHVLHGYLLSGFDFSSISQWKTCLEGIEEKEYSFMEYQANTFANAILVPHEQLEIRFNEAVSKIRRQGLDTKRYADECLDTIAFDLGKQFEVSQQTIQIRLEKEKFVNRL